jgi:hypothetical protein
MRFFGKRIPRTRDVGLDLVGINSQLQMKLTSLCVTLELKNDEIAKHEQTIRDLRDVNSTFAKAETSLREEIKSMSADEERRLNQILVLRAQQLSLQNQFDGAFAVVSEVEREFEAIQIAFGTLKRRFSVLENCRRQLKVRLMDSVTIKAAPADKGVPADKDVPSEGIASYAPGLSRSVFLDNFQVNAEGEIEFASTGGSN